MPEQFIYPNEPLHPAPKPLPPDFAPPKDGKSYAPSLWFIHDPAIYHDPVSDDYFLYCTDARLLRSHDLITWEDLGKAVSGPSEDARKWTKSDAVWAPDIVKVGDEYRLYCSNSSFGVQTSCIFLAVSDRAEGPFEPKEIVFRTSPGMYVNAIDANIIEDQENGKQYMVYGSFWGGCHITELDKETGLAKNGPDDPGLCLARRPLWADGAIEGPYIIYNPETRYYYLFVSYGSLKSDYNIRVGRSLSVTGPYLDHNGRDLTDLDDPDSTLGYMLACGYKFDDDPVGYMGPGHNSVLRDNDGSWYLVCHIRPHNFKGGEPSMLQIRKMVWTTDGWPMVSPEIYAGEEEQDVDDELLYGNYERIKLTPQIPQGMLTSVRMAIEPGGHGWLADSIHISWERTGTRSLVVRYGGAEEHFRILPAWDQEAWKPTLVLTGVNLKHTCIWGKKYD